MLLGEAVEYFLEVRQHLAEATLKGYKIRLGLFVKWMGSARAIRDITTADIERWYASLRKQRERWRSHATRPAATGKLSDHTIDNYVRGVRTLFAWLLTRRDREGNPLLLYNPTTTLEHKTPPPAKPKWLTPDQESRLLEAARQKGAAYYALIRLAFATGLRRRGLWELKVGDFDFSNLQSPLLITLEKGEQWRFVAFDAETGAAIQAWLKVRPGPTEYLWVVTRPTKKRKLGQRITLSGLRQMVRRVCKAANLNDLPDGVGTKEIGLHAFRHTAARRAFKARIPTLVIQKQFGWRDAKSMASYIRAETEDIQEHFGVDRLPAPKVPGKPLLKRVK